METFEIKLEVNGNQDDYYSMEAVDSGNEQQLVSYIIRKQTTRWLSLPIHQGLSSEVAPG